MSFISQQEINEAIQILKSYSSLSDKEDSTIIAAASLIKNSITNTNTNIPSSGSLTNSELRAAAVPVSLTALPLPTSASTSTLQITGNNSLTSIDTKIPALVTSTDALNPPSQIQGLFSQGFNGTTWDRIRAGISGVVSNVLGYTNTVNVGRYNTTPPLLSDGQWVNTQVDRNGNIKVAGSGYTSKVTITRAANIDRYIANDVYGNAFELTNFGSKGGTVILSSIRIIFNINSLPLGMGNFLLFLYDAPPPSAVTDNNAFSVPNMDRSVLLTPGGGIEIGNAKLEPGGGSVGLKADNLNLQFKLNDNQTSVWGYLVTKADFTPAAINETAVITTGTLGV